MAVTLIEEVVKVPKEINEVRKAIVGVISDIKAGKGVAEIGVSNFQALIDAIAGVDQLDDEAKEEIAASVAAAGLLASDIIGVLIPKPV